MRKWGARACMFLLYIVVLTVWALVFVFCAPIALIARRETVRGLWGDFKIEFCEITLHFLDAVNPPADDGAESGV